MASANSCSSHARAMRLHNLERAGGGRPACATCMHACHPETHDLPDPGVFQTTEQPGGQLLLCCQNQSQHTCRQVGCGGGGRGACLSTRAHKGAEEVLVRGKPEHIPMDVLPPRLLLILQHCMGTAVSGHRRVRPSTACTRHIKSGETRNGGVTIVVARVLDKVVLEDPHQDGGEEAGKQQHRHAGVDDGEPVDLGAPAHTRAIRLTALWTTALAHVSCKGDKPSIGKQGSCILSAHATSRFPPGLCR